MVLWFEQPGMAPQRVGQLPTHLLFGCVRRLLFLLPARGQRHFLQRVFAQLESRTSHQVQMVSEPKEVASEEELEPV